VEIREFHALMISAAVRLPKFAPNFGLKDGTTTLWYSEFKDVEASKFGKAVDQAVRTLHEFPSIAKLLELCGVVHLTPDQEAEALADKILAALRSPVSIRDKNAMVGQLGFNVVQSLGGWLEINGSIDVSKSFDQNWLKKILVKESFAEIKRQGTPEALPTLSRYTEALNAATTSTNEKIPEDITPEQAQKAREMRKSIMERVKALGPMSAEEMQVYKHEQGYQTALTLKKSPRMWEYKFIGDKYVNTGVELFACDENGRFYKDYL